MITLAIIVPCYNEREVLPETRRRLTALLGDLVEKGKIKAASRVYFVDDGSADDTWALIEEYAARDARIAGIKLSRNRGHQNALLAGLLNADGDALVSIDADLQDDCTIVEQMLDAFALGNDVVYGVRASRPTDTWFKRTTAELYYRLLGLIGVNVVFNHSDYRLMSRRVIDALREYREVNLFLRGLVPALGFSSAEIPYERSERQAGETKYPLRRMLALAVDGITSFSPVPLRLIAGLGLIVFLISLVTSAWVLWARLFTDQSVPGWASSVLPMYLLGGVQLLSIGVLGEYVAKIYMETKRRPRYLIDRVVGAQIHTSKDD